MRGARGRAGRALKALGLAAALLGGAGPVTAAAPPPGVDAYVVKAMQAFGAPGLSLAIVQDGKVVMAKGYGVRGLGDGRAVDDRTAFAIGSETKAFTAAALAILVDRGKLSWDDRVVDRLPGFRMYDPYTTDHMTVRDLLTHRSGLGLGEGDLLVIPGTNRSRSDVVHALRYLKPATEFRDQFAYDNILYIVAGALVESVSGQPWEDFVRKNIFTPLGMDDAHPNYAADQPNAAGLHARTSGPIRGVGPQAVLAPPQGFFHGVAPAGGISASAQDMARWMTVQLAHGQMLDGGRLYSDTQAKQMWTPEVVVPASEFKLPPGMEAMQPDLQTYALGWFVECYRGHMVIEHSGAVFGSLAMLYLMPEKHIGISVAINSEDSSTRRAVMFHLLDQYLGLPPTDWIATLTAAHERSLAEAETVLKAAPQPGMAADAALSLPLARYAGRYVDPWYGPMTVGIDGFGRLSIQFLQTPGMAGTLEPVGRDRFRTHWNEANIEDAYVDFHVVGDAVQIVTLKAISPLADFSFDYLDLHFTPQFPSVPASQPSGSASLGK